MSTICYQTVEFSLFVFTENKQQDIKVKDRLQDVFLLQCSDLLMLQLDIVESCSSLSPDFRGTAAPPPPSAGRNVRIQSRLG